MLQDVDNSGIGLIVTDPYAFVPDYSLKVEDCDAEILGTSQLNEISVIVTVSIPHGQPEKTSLNLCGPILINTVKRVGIQAPQRDPAVRQPVLLRDL
jgi:flagellar assembly factor FliW